MVAELNGNGEAGRRSYYRRDQARGITPPELTKDCSYAEHIVRARGKRTRYTSVSLDQASIVDFGPVLYQAETALLTADGHQIVEHEALLLALREAARNGQKEERARAVQAQRYALRRREGLVSWDLDFSRVERKELFEWTRQRVEKYFRVA
jgi:hypothetical protein